MPDNLQFLIGAPRGLRTLQAGEPVGQQARIITLAEVARSLPPKPNTVVFDVDDTVLFSSPGFQWGTKTYGPDTVSAGKGAFGEEVLADSEFD